MKRKSLFSGLLVLGLLVCLGAGFLRLIHAPKRYEHQTVKLGTYVQIVVLSTLPAQDIERIFAECDAEIDRCDRIFSNYREDSELSALNQSADNDVLVSEAIANMLQRSRQWSRKTQGAFDITVRPLIQLWRLAQQKQMLPTQEELNSALAVVGTERWSLEEKTVTLTTVVDTKYRSWEKTLFTVKKMNGMMFDLGGIAKGEVIAHLGRLLQEKGISCALIDIGGDALALGSAERGRPWRMAIQNPDQGDEALAYVELKDQALVTSGDYERFVDIAGKHFSHIIDPRTGWPVLGARSITVLATDVVDADAAATALSVLGPQEAQVFLKNHPELEYLLVYDVGQGERTILRSTRFAA